MARLDDLIDVYELESRPAIAPEENWTHEDAILITYADMVRARPSDQNSWLAEQHKFLSDRLSGLISSVHILPFFPSSSDDGFSVIDYRRVDEEFGNWQDIEALARDFRLMGDLVINHVSRHSSWFRKYIERVEPWVDYFIEVEPDTDLSGVTRPRSSPLVTAVETKDGQKLVWTTFSRDQIDVNFKNPVVLFDFLDIFLFYLNEGMRVIRLDAVAYLWKEIGTSCIHLPQTHEVIRLLRTVTDHFAPDATLISETNVPHKENISYFGESDEAHMVYQFSLPPLLMHALLTENSRYLTQWAGNVDVPPPGCTYMNFTASHDGVGVRPLEGLVPEEEFSNLIQGIQERGGHISYKQNPDGSMSPYELNISWFDAFASLNGQPEMQENRFFCSQLIMLSLMGVPGIYFHNLLGTPNYEEGVRLTGRYRTINRRKWKKDELQDLLDDTGSRTHRIFSRYQSILRIRKQHPAFHPFGPQRVIDAGPEWFVIERRDPDSREQVLVVANVTSSRHRLRLSDLNVSIGEQDRGEDLLTGREVVIDGEMELSPFDVVWISTG